MIAVKPNAGIYIKINKNNNHIKYNNEEFSMDMIRKVFSDIFKVEQPKKERIEIKINFKNIKYGKPLQEDN